MKSANVLAVCFYVMYIFIIWCDDVPVYLLQHVVFTCNILKFLGRTEILYFTIHHNRIIVYVQFFNQRTNIVHMAFHFEWPFITTTGVSKHTFLCTLIQINGFCYSNLYTLQSCSVQDHITFIFSNIIGNIKIISFFFIFFFCDLRRWKCELKVMTLSFRKKTQFSAYNVLGNFQLRAV